MSGTIQRPRIYGISGAREAVSCKMLSANKAIGISSSLRHCTPANQGELLRYLSKGIDRDRAPRVRILNFGEAYMFPKGSRIFSVIPTVF